MRLLATVGLLIALVVLAARQPVLHAATEADLHSLGGEPNDLRCGNAGTCDDLIQLLSCVRDEEFGLCNMQVCQLLCSTQNESRVCKHHAEGWTCLDTPGAIECGEGWEGYCDPGTCVCTFAGTGTATCDETIWSCTDLGP